MDKNNMSTEHSSIHYERLDDVEYLNGYDTKACLSMYTYPETAPIVSFMIENLVRIIYENKHRIGHDRALEFGAGPSLLPSFILAHQVKSIRFCDYIPSNLAAVEDWMNESPEAHDWSLLFNRIVQEYRKQSGDKLATRTDWEKRLREAIKHGELSKCNVNADDCPTLSGAPNEYDIVLSSMCLEEACPTYISYKHAIKRLFELLKRGGMIILIHGVNQTYYIQGKRRHSMLPLNRTGVIDALREAGFENIHDESQNLPAGDAADGDGIMAVTAFKPKLSLEF